MNGQDRGSAPTTTRPGGRRGWRIAALGAAAGTLLLAGAGPTAGTPASASVVVAALTGADSCAAPSASAMQAWWTGSANSFWGVYIGGVNRGCSQPNLTASWVNTVTAQGWYLEPIWVGPQAPCWPHTGTKFSTSTTTAFSQGQSEGQKAYTALSALGFSPGTNDNTPVVYDLEAYDTTNAACVAAVKAFVKGWDTQLALVPSQRSGVYGSTSGSGLSGLTGSPAPRFIWGAKYDGSSATSNLSPVPSTSWSNHQRLKQYQGTHSETHGGVTISIDSDSSDGPLYHR